jgi:hypothetical protein
MALCDRATAKEEGLSAEERKALRQRDSVPQLVKILAWLTATQPKVLERGPLGPAILYALLSDNYISSIVNVVVREQRAEEVGGPLPRQDGHRARQDLIRGF